MPDMKFGRVLAECASVARSNLVMVALFVAGIAALYSLMDFAAPKSMNSGLSIGSIFLQYVFLERILKDRIGTDLTATRKFGSLFLSGLLGSLGILAGMVVLIVPGIYLMARWSISAPLVVADKLNGREALATSWKATRSAHWALLLVFLVGLGVAGAFLAALVAMAATLDLADNNPGIIIATNVLVSGFMVGGWILSVALYRLLSPSIDGLADVFA